MDLANEEVFNLDFFVEDETDSAGYCAPYSGKVSLVQYGRLCSIVQGQPLQQLRVSLGR